MTKKSSSTKSLPMTQEAKARIYSATARENDGTIPPDSFALFGATRSGVRSNRPKCRARRKTGR